MPKLSEWTPTLELRWYCPHGAYLNQAQGMNPYAGGNQISYGQPVYSPWKLQQKFVSTRELDKFEWRDIPYHSGP